MLNFCHPVAQMLIKKLQMRLQTFDASICNSIDIDLSPCKLIYLYSLCIKVSVHVPKGSYVDKSAHEVSKTMFCFVFFCFF